MYVGRPYSAVVETDATHTLEHGTRIERKRAEVDQYRDSPGRTGTEHTAMPMGRAFMQSLDGATSIMFSDPIALKR